MTKNFYVLVIQYDGRWSLVESGSITALVRLFSDTHEEQVMCELMAYFGWLEMSPGERWTLVLNFGAIAIAFIFGITTWWQWRLAKRIELEASIISNVTYTLPVLQETWREALGKGDEDARKDAKMYMDKAREAFQAVRREDKPLTLMELRKLNRDHIGIAGYVRGLSDIEEEAPLNPKNTTAE